MTAGEVIGLPPVGSRWEFPRWTNLDYTGAWAVAAVVPHHPEAEWIGPTIVLHREADPEHEHLADLAFWPGGWIPA